MLITRWIVGLLVTASATTADAQDDVNSNDVPLETVVECVLSDDDEISAEASNMLVHRFQLGFELDWWNDEESTKARNRYIQAMAPFVPQIVRALNSDHPKTRENATDLLANLGPQSADVALAVWESVRIGEFPDDELSGYWQLMNGLCVLKGVLPEELPAMSFVVSRVRELCDQNPEALSVEIVAGDDSSDQTGMHVRRLGTTVALYHILLLSAGWGPIEVPGLVELTAPEFPRTIRLWAIMVLTNMGSDAVSAAPDLVRLLASDDELLRSLTARALLSFHRKDADVNAILTRARLSTEDADEIRSDYSEFVSDLEKEQERLRDTDPESARDTVEQLRRILKYTRGSLRLDACRMLIHLSNHAQPALPELREAQLSAEPLLRELATEAIVQIVAEHEAPAGN